MSFLKEYVRLRKLTWLTKWRSLW